MTDPTPQDELARNLSARHIQLLAIGGTIGTGLFLGAGQSIHVAGPALIFAYLLAGVMCFFLLRALGELLLADDGDRSFLDLIRHHLGPRAAFVTGWTYWFCWVAIAMAQVTAIGVYIRFWWPSLPQWLPALVALVLLLAVNLTSVASFGELEFWFSMIKVVAIAALIVIGAGMIFGHSATSAGAASLANLTAHGGLLPKGWWGFMLAFQMVAFSFTSIEQVGLTAAEAHDPQRTLPRVLNSLPVMVIALYVGALVVLMSIFPWNKVSASGSPFVQVFASLNIPGAASIVNFVVLTAAASACMACIYSAGRLLFELSLQQPRLAKLAKLSRRQVPVRGLTLSSIVIAVAIALNVVLPASVFTLVSSVATVCFLFVWTMIIVAHLRYKRRHPAPGLFAAPLFPLGDWYVLAFLAFVFVVMFFSRDTAIATSAALLLLAALTIAARRQGPHPSGK
ncbi:amino acid permease [Lacticaseibacillus jixianensis]|uniref:Amino acid permease n=1 Tax=Lacticaseibacillus jixianensis TaxID=2486012 RepID=A0ABW4B800_9LACO|nr:amino acid permease [Lacticaseibacillus jixianensis]